MISSVPQSASIPLSETALYQMFCDLSDLLGAGWEMKLAPSIEGNPGVAQVIFRLAAPPPDSENIPFGESIVRFSLASDLPNIVRKMHRRVFRLPPSAAIDSPVQ